MKHFISVLAFLIPFSSLAFTVVLVDGSRLEAVDAPTYIQGRAVFRIQKGSLTSLPESRIDKVATDKANMSTTPTPGTPKKDALPSGGKSKATFTDADLPKRTPEEIAKDEQARREAVQRQREQDSGFNVYQHNVDVFRSDADAMMRDLDRAQERAQEAREEAERARRKAEEDQNWGWHKK